MFSIRDSDLYKFIFDLQLYQYLSFTELHRKPIILINKQCNVVAIYIQDDDNCREWPIDLPSFVMLFSYSCKRHNGGIFSAIAEACWLHTR